MRAVRRSPEMKQVIARVWRLDEERDVRDWLAAT
jgi:hypothetical protein